MAELTTQEYFLANVARYLKHTGYSENKLAFHAIGTQASPGFFNRVREGKASLDLMTRVDTFIRDNPDGLPIRR